MSYGAPAFVIAVAAVVRTIFGLWLGFRPFDDTYITFRYSLNLASGHGLVHNIGQPVLGTTTPLWALVLALAAALGASIERARSSSRLHTFRQWLSALSAIRGSERTTR